MLFPRSVFRNTVARNFVKKDVSTADLATILWAGLGLRQSDAVSSATKAGPLRSPGIILTLTSTSSPKKEPGNISPRKTGCKHAAAKTPDPRFRRGSYTRRPL